MTENKEMDLIIQEYKNMHSQLEVLNDELPKIKDYLAKTLKSTEQYSNEAKNQRSGLQEQIALFKETQKAANNLIETLSKADDKINDMFARIEFIEKRIGLDLERKAGIFSDDLKSILDRLDRLEKDSEQN